MAWLPIPGNPMWEYDNAPPDPGNAQSALWAKQTGGIRTNPNGIEIYTKCRMIGSTKDSNGEMNKTHWDSKITYYVVTSDPLVLDTTEATAVV